MDININSTAHPDSGAFRDPAVFQTLTAVDTRQRTLGDSIVWRVTSDEVGVIGEYVGDEACEALAQAWEDVA